MFDPGLIGLAINPFFIIRRALHREIARVAPRAEGRLLDVGCGSKPYAHLFGHVAEYIGLDLAVSGHDHANSRVDVFYDGEHMPFADGDFDTIVSFETLEHVFNLDTVLGEIRRVLREGGLLIVSLPFAWDEHEVPYDFARYTSFGLAHILARAGFELIELRKSGTYVGALIQLFIAYLHQRVLPRTGVLGRLGQVLVIAPVSLFGTIAAAVAPSCDLLYSNLVVTARKR